MSNLSISIRQRGYNRGLRGIHIQRGKGQWMGIERTHVFMKISHLFVQMESPSFTHKSVWLDCFVVHSECKDVSNTIQSEKMKFAYTAKSQQKIPFMNRT
ncbi:MAG: hypothetical protein CMJ95_01650 [Planctomycetes bacterium]|nr:hypothetical protein [Planctomycetota bacterium]